LSTRQVLTVWMRDYYSILMLPVHVGFRNQDIQISETLDYWTNWVAVIKWSDDSHSGKFVQMVFCCLITGLEFEWPFKFQALDKMVVCRVRGQITMYHFIIDCCKQSLKSHPYPHPPPKFWMSSSDRSNKILFTFMVKRSTLAKCFFVNLDHFKQIFLSLIKGLKAAHRWSISGKK
jgi:hypothetical protein